MGETWLSFGEVVFTITSVVVAIAVFMVLAEVVDWAKWKMNERQMKKAIKGWSERQKEKAEW